MKIIKFIIFLSLISVVSKAQTKNFLDQPYLDVTGSADTLVTPNEIFIKIIIAEKDSRDKTSVEEQELKMVKALKALGIKTEKNLTTSDMASNFKSYFLKGKEVVKSKEYMLKVDDAVTASKVFIELENIGISNTSIDRVNHSELEMIKNEIRSRAIINARKKAIALTKPLQQTVGPAIHISDMETSNFNRQLPGRVGAGMLQEVVVVGYASGKKELPQIEFEKINVTSNIAVKFILK
jgi:uncharacterized protein